MKLRRSILLCLVVAASASVVSSSASAEINANRGAVKGRLTPLSVSALDRVIAKIKQANTAVNNGAPSGEVISHIKEADDICKGIKGNDQQAKTDLSSARGKLKSAVSEAKSENLQAAKERLNEALHIFERLKGR